MAVSTWAVNSGVDRPTSDRTGGVERLLVTVAHPDDETFGTGSLLAHAAQCGVDVTVACATRGEAGDPVPGSVSPGQELAAVRERELREAAAHLGVERVVVFDWTDSGMDGEAASGSLVAASLGEVAARLVELIDEVRPTIVVTLDGSDGHRDHLHVRDATVMAVRRATWEVGRVYLHCLPQRLMRRWVEALESSRSDAAHLGIGELGTPESEITTVVDTAAVRHIRDEAMMIHASQTPPYAVMPPDLQDAFLNCDALRRVHPPWPGGPRETTIFGSGPSPATPA